MLCYSAVAAGKSIDMPQIDDLLLPVTTNTAESIWYCIWESEGITPCRASY